MRLIALNLLALLASLFPWDLGQQADPLKPAPAGIHPEWYFMSQFQVLKLLGRWLPGTVGEIVGLLVFTLGLVMWFLIPLYDSKSKSGQRARWATYLVLLVLVGLVITTAWGYLSI